MLVIVLSNLMRFFYQEIILSSGVFRRETASGFYPWGKVEGPRKRVAEGLCGWRHGNSFPCRKAHSRTAKCEAFHIAPRLFFMFLFLIPFTIRQHCIIYPQEFSTEPVKGFEWIKWMFFLLYGCCVFCGEVGDNKEAVSQGLGNCFCDLESSG